MAQTAAPTAATTAKYTVLRAICMGGERVEVGDTVEMTAVQYAEAASAGKVGPLAAGAADKSKRSSKAKPAEAADAAPAEGAPAP